ncbi:MAG: PKD domain-containing protein, partial [Saprospiraceae bacterium]
MKKSLISVVSLMLLASITVANAQIQMTFSTVQPTCHGFTNGSATVFPIGGAGGYTYFWSTNQTTQTTFGIGMGTYTVTVTDAVQNTASGQISVSEPTAVTASITAGNLSCSGNSGQLTASGFGGAPPYSYAWDGPGGPSSFRFMQVVAPGNYFVTVTDANNCSGVSSFNVPTALSVEVTATDIPCSTLPQGGSANVVATGGVAPYVYNWSNGEHTTQINNLSQGPYFCTVTSANGCVGIDSDNVDIPAPLVVVITWLSPSCGFSNNGQATVQASGGTPPYVYNWPSPLPSGPSQTGLAPGLYYVCTFDSNMCQNDLWVNIPHITGLNVQLVVNSATCLGIDNASATAVVNPAGSNYVYQWNILPPDSNVVQLTGLAAGTFISVTVTDTLSGCTGTASGIVGAHSNINLAVTDIDILCAGGFGSATALASNGTPPYSYTWYSDTIKIGDTPSIGGLNPGAYLVTVEDFLGCQAQAVADISIQSAPNALIGPASVLLCGDSLSIVQFTNESTDPYNVIATLEWTVTHNGVDTTINQLNQITLPLPVDDTITVRLIVTSGLGCKDTAMLFYNVPGYPHFTISLDSATLNCTGDSIKINVINGDTTYNYVWSPAVTPNPNPLHVLVYPTTTTTYVLTVTDGNACTAVDSITIVPAAGFELFVAEKIIKTCGDSAMLFAYTIPSNILIIWFQGNDTLIGNPVKVPASSTTTIYTVKAFASDTCYLMEQVSVTSYDLEISIDPDAETSVCEGDSLLLSVIVNPASDSLSYLWSVNAPGILTTPTLANPILSGPVGVYTVTVIVTNVICADTLSFQVEILPGLNFPGQVTADLCNGLEVQFFNNVSGTWDFGDNSGLDTTMNPVHTYTASGQYRVIFTADLQCASPWDSTITVFDSVLTAGITHLYINCSTEALVQLNGSANHAGNNTWDWTFPNGTPATSTVQNPTVTYNNEGIYTATLVVTDINGCTATATDTIIVEIINDFIPNPAPICPGDCVQLNPDGFDLGANYSWTSVPVDSTLFGQENIPNPTVCPLVPTIYTANVSTGLCTVKYSVLVTFKQGGIVILPDDMIVCSNDSVSITALSNGATMFEWSINDTFVPIFATTQTVTVQPPGTFYVRTKGTECTAVDSIHIGLSQLDLLITQITNIVCEGDFGSATALASNGTPPYTYIWFNDVPLPIGNNASITGLSAGTYTVLATDSVGCTTIDTVNITVLSAPNALIDSAYVLECGESLSTVRFISLSSDAFDQIDSLKWIITGPGINVVILQQDTVDIQLPVGDTITVTLIATSSLGCSDTTSLEFLVPGIPDFSISLDSTSLNCNGGPLTLIVDGDPDYDYSWEPAVTIIGPLHVLVNPTVPTTYVLTATDGGVCTAVDSIRVTPVDGSFQLIVLDSIIQTCDTTVTLFASTIPAGIATIVWCKGLTPIGGNPIVVPATSTPTIYTVKAITADSCFRMDQVVVQGYGADVELDPNAET